MLRRGGVQAVRRVAAVLVVVALIAAALFASKEPADHPAPAPAVVTAAPAPTQVPAAVASPVRGVAPVPVLPPRPKPTEPLRVAFPALLALAQSGDVEAMLDLGMRLQHCMPFGLARERELVAAHEREFVAAEEIVRAAAPDDAKLLPDLVLMRRSLDEQRAGIAECDAIDEAQRGNSLVWVEKAADAGSEPARGYYVTHALEEFSPSDNASLMLNIDTVIERRDRARRYMRENIEHCAWIVFRQQLLGLDASLGVSDPYARAVAARASVREDGTSGRASAAQRVFDEAAESLDAATRARAEQAGDAMYQRCAPR